MTDTVNQFLDGSGEWFLDVSDGHQFQYYKRPEYEIIELDYPYYEVINTKDGKLIAGDSFKSEQDYIDFCEETGHTRGELAYLPVTTFRIIKETE